MFAIDLYEKYVANSTNGLKGEQLTQKLNYEKEKVNDILSNIDDLFYNDKALFDKKDHTIYTMIKREIVTQAQMIDINESIHMGRFKLQGILYRLNELMERIAA